MSDVKKSNLSETQRKELEEFFRMLPLSFLNYVCDNLKEDKKDKVQGYIKGFHDGALFVLEELKTVMK
jgi:hypothetical protein